MDELFHASINFVLLSCGVCVCVCGLSSLYYYYYYYYF